MGAKTDRGTSLGPGWNWRLQVIRVFAFCVSLFVFGIIPFLFEMAMARWDLGVSRHALDYRERHGPHKRTVGKNKRKDFTLFINEAYLGVSQGGRRLMQYGVFSSKGDTLKGTVPI